MGRVQVDLTGIEPARLSFAVESAIQTDRMGDDVLPSAFRLQQSAKAAIDSAEPEFATWFGSILEIAYLVASADGFVTQERQALSQLLERVTGRAATQEILELHFKDLDEGCEMLGRRERLRRAAEDFADRGDRAQVLGFAALVALADGRLDQAELEALGQVGSFLGFSEPELDEVLAQVVSRVKAGLKG